MGVAKCMLCKMKRNSQEPTNSSIPASSFLDVKDDIIDELNITDVGPLTTLSSCYQCFCL